MDNVPYTVKREVAWLVTGTGVSACDGGSIVTYPSISVHVQVTWPNMGNVTPIVSDTVLTPPKNVLNASSAYIAVKVLDRDGQPNESRVVTASGPAGTIVDTTGPDGCATFVLSSPGTYTLSLSEGSSGYVSFNGATSQTATVTAGSLTVRSFSYDLGVSLRATLKPPTGFNLPSTAIPATIGNSGILPAGVASYPTTGGVANIGPVWPFVVRVLDVGRQLHRLRPGPQRRTSCCGDPGQGQHHQRERGAAGTRHHPREERHPDQRARHGDVRRHRELPLGRQRHQPRHQLRRRPQHLAALRHMDHLGQQWRPHRQPARHGRLVRRRGPDLGREPVMSISPLARRVAAARRGENGVTLVEMSVTVLVLSMLVGALVMMVTASQRVSGGVKERMDQTNAATIGMERISRNLRTAVLQSQLTTACILSACTDSAFLVGSPTSVQFYADVDNPKNSVGPSRVTYAVVGGVLSETVQKPDSPTPDAAGYHYCTSGVGGCLVRSTILATDVQTATAVFTYYTAAAPTTAMVMGTGGVLTAAQLKTVDSIDVSIQIIKTGGANVGGTSLVQRVALPNADSVVRTDGT